MLCAVQGVAAQAEVGQATRLVGSQQHVSNAHVPVLDTMPEATNQQESEDKWRGGGARAKRGKSKEEGKEERGERAQGCCFADGLSCLCRYARAEAISKAAEMIQVVFMRCFFRCSLCLSDLR